MTDVEAAFTQAAADLDEMGVDWAVIGGLAVSARAAPRFTQDVDFAVSVATDDEAESIVHRLQVRGYAVGMLVEQDETGRLATVRLIRPVPGSSQIFVDLLFASSGIEDMVVKQAERIEILPGCVAPVASIGHLIALKLLSADENRLQDRVDLRALLTVASPDDLMRARHAADAIVARGFNRGRSLPQDLERLMREQRLKPSSERTVGTPAEHPGIGPVPTGAAGAGPADGGRGRSPSL